MLRIRDWNLRMRKVIFLLIGWTKMSKKRWHFFKWSSTKSLEFTGKKRTTNKSKKSCLTDFTTFDPVMVLWLVLACLHLSELTGRIGQSASGTRQFCWSARDATCQSSHTYRAGVVWLEADLSPQNRRIPLADSDWPVLTNSKGAQLTAALASMAAISTPQIKNLIGGWNELEHAYCNWCPYCTHLRTTWNYDICSFDNKVSTQRQIFTSSYFILKYINYSWKENKEITTVKELWICYPDRPLSKIP